MQQFIATPAQLGRVLRGYRKARGLTQERAASKVGMRAKTVSAIEGGQGAGSSIETLFKLLSALDLELVILPKGAPTAPEW